MLLKQKLMIGATALFGMGVGSLGLGVAHASTGSTNPPAVHASVTDGPEVAGASTEPDAPGGHQDLNNADVQYGSQTGADATESSTTDGPDASGGPDVQSGSQTGPDTGSAHSAAG